MMWVRYRNELNHECMSVIRRVEYVPRDATVLYLYGEGVGGFHEAHFPTDEARVKAMEVLWRGLHFGGHGKANFCAIDISEFQ